MFHVVDVIVGQDDHHGAAYSATIPQYMNGYGQWGNFIRYSQGLIPDFATKLVTVKKAGWFSPEERVIRVSWLDEPPQPQLRNILKRTAELLAPTS